ncbi:PAS domain S-box protein [Leptolyngbya sp. FACHB-671]|uniref:hybrid sensor histidine kinase/response regulator n=1 Tax=Leptolyngbya sp. FACHB-671 TaxID=2692812 RepID=UPI0016894F48|nr:ATP-binding protein [Leptolyngbya sp. FACHB-671]MBD2067293.1 PAS domain S-box protein [Leptolyngbya sp. FACHB-671]
MRAEEPKEIADSPFAGNSEISALLRSYDWSQTPLGGIETWSESLKAAVQSRLAELNQAQRPEAMPHASVLSQNCNQTDALRESEARYRTLFKLTDQGCCICEMLFDENGKPADYRFLEVNPVFEHLTGLEQATGKRMRELAPNLEAYWVEIYGRVVQSRESARFENYASALDRWFDINAFCIGEPQDHQFAVLFTNITERKKVEQERDRFLAAGSDLQVIMSSHGYFHWVSPAFERILGWTPEEMISRPWTDFLHPDDIFASVSESVSVLSGNETFAFENRYRHKDGSYHWLLWRAQPHLEAQVLYATAVDITDRVRVEDERKQAEAALRQSEEQYRIVFESIDEGFCTIELLFDAEGKPFDHRILQANPAFKRQTGIANPEGKRASELIPGLEQYWNDLYAQVIHTGESIRTEVRSDALDRWFDVLVSRVGDAAMCQVAIVFADISDRKQAEAIITHDLKNTRLLRDLSARMIAEDNIQVLYDEIVSAAITLTRADTGSIQALDESTQELVLIATQGIDRTVIKRFQRMSASSITSCGRVLATGKRAFVDFDAPESEDPDGSLRLHLKTGLISAQSTPLIGRSGRRIGMVSTHWRKHHRPTEQELRFLDLLARQAADLIEQRQTEAERKQVLDREQAAREEAERANRIKDEFLAVLSHELRSPLNPILGWTQLLRNGKVAPARQKDALATIERNAKLQAQLIEDLLDISRIMQGKLSLSATSVSLAFIIAAAVETVSLAADAKNIQITLDLDPDVAPVFGDAARLQQVVWNLLTNALKFTGNGGQVTIQLKQVAEEGSLGNSTVQIRVIDTGKGISPQFLPHVFEYFRQEDGSTTRKFGGLGLGLAIVRQIVELHGGTVQAESSGEHQGSTFIVQLPTLQANPLNLEPVQVQANSEMQLQNVHILLVDDDTDTREFEAFLLERQGATVIAAASGSEALQALDRLIPDVIVSDIGMAEIDGYMLMQQIRSRPPAQGGMIPAIALTAYATEIDQEKALQSGFQKHLTKPLEPEQLVSAVITLLNSNRH